jgi:Putative beta barrel porin-7 (BBP7)
VVPQILSAEVRMKSRKLLLLLGLAVLARPAVVAAQPTPAPKLEAPVPLTTAESIPPAPATTAVSEVFAAGDPSTPRIWGSVDYLLWWVRPQTVSVPLVTTGNPNDKTPGALDNPGTKVLFGGNNLDYGAFSGIRTTVGMWLDSSSTIGIEGSWFQLEQRSTHFGVASDMTGNPPIYMPTINQDPTSSNFGGKGSITIADPLFPPPGPTFGRLSIDTTTRLWGAEANGIVNFGRSGGLSASGIFGFRYADLAERLHIDGFSNETGIDIQQSFFDDFSTSNHFYGGQLGVKLGYETPRFFANVIAKAALGTTHETVDVEGQSVYSGTGFNLPAGLYPGGIYAQPSNIGSRSMDRFTVMPTVQVDFGVNITAQLRASVGYDFLYWSSVVRPGQQIDPNLNPNQFPGVIPAGSPLIGPPLPGPLFNRTDFWAQGIHFSVEYRF